MDRGLLYRLDYGTSGILILKDEEDYQYLRNDFNNLVKEKSYLAIVSGRFEGELSILLTFGLFKAWEKNGRIRS